MNQYETVFILTPVLSDVQIKESVEKYEKLIVDNGGEILHRDNWGMRKLAYSIKKKNTGYYYLIEFKSAPAFSEKLEVEYRRDERLLRFQTVKLEKEAAAYSARRRGQQSETQKN
jgi:small subunit ribosomal protein S6